MKKIKTETIFDPSQENLEIINQGLHMFKLAHLGRKTISTYLRMMVLAKDGAGTIVGGIHGEMHWDWLHIDTLWVDEKHRG